MEKKATSRIMLIVLLLSMFTLAFNGVPVKGEEATEPETEPILEFIDFQNGTRQMIIDYNNGTRDYVTETFIKKTVELSVPEDDLNQSSPITLPTSLEESTDYINSTHTLMMKQEVLMGFTYEIVKERWEIVSFEGYWVWWKVWQLKAGCEVDIGLGLRLPVNITLTYPEQMQVGKNYTLSAMLTPIDKPDFNEFLCVFKAYLWVELWVRGFGTWKKTFGPNYDFSHSFITPLGPEAEVGLLSINVTIWDIGMKFWIFDLGKFLEVKLSITPAFGSEKITAKASAIGDGNVVEGADLMWSTPNQRLNFTVKADDYDPTTDYATIVLSDFRYYFTKLIFYVDVVFDFHDFVNNYFSFADPRVNIATIDVSWLLKGFYLPAHPGYPRTISVIIHVETLIPPPRLFTTIDIDPDTLNLKSKGEWITAYIEFPEGYDVSNINASTILLNNTLGIDPYAPMEIGDYDNNSLPDLMVKFNRSEVISLLNVGNETIKITGRLTDGTQFEATDMIRAIHAQITLTDLHSIHLNVDGAFLKGENLKVKFYSYSGAYQGETTVWSGTTPAQIHLSMDLSQNSPIENAIFKLTDNEENTILNLINFVVHRSDLFGRIVQIDVRWTFAPPEERRMLWREMVAIDMQWPYAPS